MTCHIYLAGPVDGVEDAAAWRDDLIDSRDGVAFLNPLEQYDASAAELSIVDDCGSTESDDVVSVAELVQTDKHLLRQADGVLVGYSDVQQIGTPMEVLFAFQRGLPVALYVRDDTVFDDLSPWYRYHTSCITNSRDLAVDHLVRSIT